MFDHISLVASDFACRKAFYTQALAPVGLDPDGHNIEAVCHQAPDAPADQGLTHGV